MTAAVVHATPSRREERGGRPGSVAAVQGVPRAAVLGASSGARVAAAGVALALARALGRPCGIGCAVGAGPPGSLAGAPAARRAVARLHERDLSATASGRLVWLADARGMEATADAPAHAAALSAELGRAAAAVGAPGAVALPFPRTAALDRVLAWHDAIVVVREPDVSEAMLGRALTSLRALGRPVAAMAPPSRLETAIALSGLRPPAAAERAIAELGVADSGDGGRRDA